MSTLFVEEASQNISAGNKNRQLVIDTLTLKAPPVICSRRQLKNLPLLQK